MSEEPTTNTNAAPDGAMRKGDWILLVAVAALAIPLVLFGYGVMVMGVLGVIMIISFMTMQAVMEERGRDDPAVKRMKKLLPLLAVALVPPLVVGLLVDSFPRWLALLPCLAALVVVIWNAHRVKAPVTFRKLLRGAGEKEPAYLDMQLLRNALLVTIICVIAMLGDSGARSLWDRDAQSIARDAEESLDESRESLASLSAATDELMANMIRVTSEAYAQWTAPERHEFLDRIEQDGNAEGDWNKLLERLLELEEDPELRRKIERIKERWVDGGYWGTGQPTPVRLVRNSLVCWPSRSSAVHREAPLLFQRGTWNDERPFLGLAFLRLRGAVSAPAA